MAFGRVQTAQSLDLLSEVSGRMFEGQVRLKEGQNFRKGTLLFYIDDESYAHAEVSKEQFSQGHCGHTARYEDRPLWQF